MATVLLPLAAFATALLGAVCGIGGGILLRPLLDAGFGMDAATASFLSGCTVLAMASAAVLRSMAYAKKARAPKRNPRVSVILSAGAAVGGILGKQLFERARRFFPDHTVGTAQAWMIFLMCAAVLAYLLMKKRIQLRKLAHPALIVGAGLGLGVISAFLGIGGGPFNHMVLSYFFGMDIKTGALHSLYIVLFSQAASFAVIAVTGAWPAFDWAALLLMAAAGALGGLIGSAVSKRAGQGHVEWTLRGALVLIMGVSVYNAAR